MTLYTLHRTTLHCPQVIGQTISIFSVEISGEAVLIIMSQINSTFFKAWNNITVVFMEMKLKRKFSQEDSLLSFITKSLFHSLLMSCFLIRSMGDY